MNNKNLKTVGIFLLFLILVFVIMKYFLDKKDLEKEYRVTIGKVYNYKILIKSGYALYFNYSVNGKRYVSDYIIYDNPKDFLNKRFFVIFTPSYPKNCKILLEKPVPDEIKQAPFEGWERIPK